MILNLRSVVLVITCLCSILTIQAQEQLTSFVHQKNFDLKQIIQANGHTYAYYEREDRSSTRIFKLTGANSELVYSFDANIELEEFGKTNNHYYVIYEDHIELFSFADNEIQSIHFGDSIGVSNLEFCVNYLVFDHGMFILPDDTEQPMTVINFSTGEFLKQTNLMKRITFHLIYVDSILFIQRSNEAGTAVIAQNLFTDEIHRIKADPENIYMWRFGKYPYVNKNGKIYLTRGTPQTTFYAFDEVSSYDAVPISFEDEEYTILIYDDHYPTDSVKLKNFSVTGELKYDRIISCAKDSVIPEYNTIQWLSDNEIIGHNRYSGVGHILLDQDSTFNFPMRVLGRDQYKYYTFEKQQLHVYNAKNRNYSKLSSLAFPHNVNSIHKVNDSLFYLRVETYNGRGIWAYDIAANKTEFIIHHKNEITDGMYRGKMHKAGDELFLMEDDSLYYLNGNKFEKVTFKTGFSTLSIDFRYWTKVLEFEDELYIIGEPYRYGYLFKWDGKGTFYSITDYFDLWKDPFLFIKGNELYADLKDGLHLMDVNNEKVYPISPYPDESVHVIHHEQIENYILAQVNRYQEENEIWLYDALISEWYLVATESDEYYSDYQYVDEDDIYVLNQRLMIMLERRNYIPLSYHIPTGVHSICFQHTFGEVQSYASFLTSYGDYLLFLVGVLGSSEKYIYRTNGTPEGTSLIYSSVQSEYFYKYHFHEGKYHFTALDSTNTNLVSFDTLTEKFAVEPWTTDHAVLTQFKLGDHTFAIVNDTRGEELFKIIRKEEDNYSTVHTAPSSNSYRSNYINYFDEVLYEQVNDTTFAVFAELDNSKMQLWLLYASGRLVKKTDFIAPFRYGAYTELLSHNENLYILSSHHPVGSQVWRIPLHPKTTSSPLVVDRNQLDLYPNPTSDYIQLADLPKEKAQITIYNGTGIPILIRHKEWAETQMRLPVDDLAGGVYYIVLQGQNILRSSQFTVID